jgi:hypothetical protein
LLRGRLTSASAPAVGSGVGALNALGAGEGTGTAVGVTSKIGGLVKPLSDGICVGAASKIGGLVKPLCDGNGELL